MDGQVQDTARVGRALPAAATLVRENRPDRFAFSGSGPRVRLLDGFSLRVGDLLSDGTRDDLPRGGQRLVAFLCLSRRPARSAVAGQLWPDVPEKQAHGSLRSALWRVGAVAPGLVDSTGGALSLSPDVRVDIRELCSWARRARDPRTDLDHLAPFPPALQADLLPGWYDDWVLLERERLRQLRLHALETLAARLAEDGRHAEAVDTAYLAVLTEPLRECAHRTLVRVHLAEGNATEALRAYVRYRDLVRVELGVAPTERFTRQVAGLGKGRRAAS
jgi:DNA-binding SARP family transcriptional activator